jgi:hypothetical protein
MKFGHNRSQNTAKRSHELRRAVRNNSWDLSDRVLLKRVPASNEACTVNVGLTEKTYELRSWGIWSAKELVICRPSNNIDFSLTVKNQEPNGEKIFTVRFTVKSLRLGAIDS